MTEYLDNPAQMAASVAEIVLQDSYSTPSRGVREIFLFGSTLRGKARDIDLLVVHNIGTLAEFGLISKYDEKVGRRVPDFEKKIEDERYRASDVLIAMGARHFYSETESRQEVMRAAREQMRGICRDGVFSGDLYLPIVGTVSIEQESLPAAIDRVYRAFDDMAESETVFGKVRSLFADKGLKVDEVLDLHVMDIKMLDPEMGTEGRQLAMRQCRDPTFWPSVLSSGRLYDRETNRFDIPIGEKYPGTIEVFTP